MTFVKQVFLLFAFILIHGDGVVASVCSNRGQKREECPFNCHADAICERVHEGKGWSNRSPRTYECICPEGFEGDGYNECVDINECEFENQWPCEKKENGGMCTNRHPYDEPFCMFECGCRDGFEPTSTSPEHGDRTCENIDECLSPDLNNCHPNAMCEDTHGSYECICQFPFEGDGINDCELEEGQMIQIEERIAPGCVPQCREDLRQECRSEINKANETIYFCGCVEGCFSPSGVGGTCFDAPSCENGRNDCDENASCTESSDRTVCGYNCKCNSGFFGDGFRCDQCITTARGCKTHPHTVCAESKGRNLCVCLAGYGMMDGECVSVPTPNPTPSPTIYVPTAPVEAWRPRPRRPAPLTLVPTPAPKIDTVPTTSSPNMDPKTDIVPATSAPETDTYSCPETCETGDTCSQYLGEDTCNYDPMECREDEVSSYGKICSCGETQFNCVTHSCEDSTREATVVPMDGPVSPAPVALTEAPVEPVEPAIVIVDPTNPPVNLPLKDVCPKEYTFAGTCFEKGLKCNYGKLTCPEFTHDIYQFDCECNGDSYECMEASCPETDASTNAPVDPTGAPVELTNAPVDPTEAPVELTNAPVNPTEAPVEPTNAPVDPTEAPVDPTNAPVNPTEAPVAPTNAPVDPTEAPVSNAPVDATGAPVEPTNAPVDATEAPVAPTNAPVDATEAPVAPTNAPVDPTGAPVEPTNAPVNPTEAPVASTNAPVDPTGAPIEPTNAPVNPTEAPVEPTIAPVDPTGAPVEPTNAPVDPTGAPVGPTNAPVNPTEAPVAPTSAPVDPTGAPVEPTNALVGATGAPVAPRNAPVNPTEAPVEPESCDSAIKTCKDNTIRTRNADDNCKFYKCDESKSVEEDDDDGECERPFGGIEEIHRDMKCPEGSSSSDSNNPLTLKECHQICKSRSDCAFFSWGEDPDKAKHKGVCMTCGCGSEFKRKKGFNCYGPGNKSPDFYDESDEVTSSPPTPAPTENDDEDEETEGPCDGCVKPCNDGSFVERNPRRGCQYKTCSSGDLDPSSVTCAKPLAGFQLIGSNIRCPHKDPTRINKTKSNQGVTLGQCHDICKRTPGCTFFSFGENPKKKKLKGQCITCRCAAEITPGFQIQQGFNTYGAPRTSNRESDEETIMSPSMEPSMEPIPCLNANVNLDISRAVLKENNLGAGGIRYSGVGNYDGALIDMVVTVGGGGYSKKGSNGLNGAYGTINLSPNHSVTLNFALQNSDTKELITLPGFYFSVFDIDKSRKTGEEFVATGFTHATYDASNSEAEFTSCGGGCLKAKATHKGGACDNPSNPLSLGTVKCNGNTVNQGARSFTLQFSNKSSFSLKWSTPCFGKCGSGGRNFLFAFRSSLVSSCK